MNKIKSFKQFLNEDQTEKMEMSNSFKENQFKVIDIQFEIDWNSNIGKVNQKITLAMSPNSLGMYDLAPDIEKFTGLPKKEAKVYNETPEDAFVYGMCNVMNGGKDLFFWTNGTRLEGAISQNGLWPAILEQISHECLHLTRLILAKHILEKMKSKDWISDSWPSIGDDPKLNLIDEEAFATALGLVVQQITPHFINMAKQYVPQLNLN